MDGLCERVAELQPGLPEPLLQLAVSEVVCACLCFPMGECRTWESAVAKAAASSDEILQDCIQNCFLKLKAAFLGGDDLAPFLEKTARGKLENLPNALELERSVPTHSKAEPNFRHAQTQSGIHTDELLERSISTLCCAICERIGMTGELFSKSEAVPKRMRMDVQDYSVPYGSAVILVDWMHSSCSGNEHEKRLLAALEGGWETLQANKEGMEITGSLDFGIKRTGATLEEKKASGIAALEIWRDDIVKSYYRSITVFNNGTHPITLLEVRAVPLMEESFAVHHDLTCQQKKYKVTKLSQVPPTSGVLLQPGTQYQITVVNFLNGPVSHRASKLVNEGPEDFLVLSFTILLLSFMIHSSKRMLGSQ